MSKTADGGKTWTRLSEGMTTTDVRGVAIDPSSPKILFAGTDEGIFRSDDGGEEWTQVHKDIVVQGSIGSFVFDPNDPKRIWSRDADTIYTSEDGGKSWKESEVPDRGSSLVGLFGFAATPEALFLSTHAGLFRSSDGGKTWSKSGAGIPHSQIQTIVYDKVSKTIYVGTEGEGVFKSADGGATWTAGHQGLGRMNVQVLLIDPADASQRTLYAATWKKGMFRSRDGGTSWTPIGGEAPHPDLIVLAPDYANPGRILVGTAGRGVWSLDTKAAAAASASRLRVRSEEGDAEDAKP